MAGARWEALLGAAAWESGPVHPAASTAADGSNTWTAEHAARSSAEDALECFRADPNDDSAASYSVQWWLWLLERATGLSASATDAAPGASSVRSDGVCRVYAIATPAGQPAFDERDLHTGW